MTPTLRLTVIEPDDVPAPDRVRAVTGTALRIGREDDNDWVLTDSARRMSRHHCTIEFRGGVYLVIDTSANGVFHDDAPLPIGRGNSRILGDGDRLRFPGVTLAVSLIEDPGTRDAFRAVLPPRQDSTPPAADARPRAPYGASSASPGEPWWPDPLGGIALPEAQGTGSPFDAAFSSLNLAASPIDGTPLAWSRGDRLGAAPEPALPASWPGFGGGDRSEPEHQAFPTALPGQQGIPEDWDREAPPGIASTTAPSIPPDWVDEPAESPGALSGRLEAGSAQARGSKQALGAAAPPWPGGDALVLALVAALARIERALLGPDAGLMQGPAEATLRRLRATEPALAQRAVALISERAAERIEALSGDAPQDRIADPPAPAAGGPSRPGDHEA